MTPDQIHDFISFLYPDFKYRENQREAIEYTLHLIVNSPKKYIILDAPVGLGKSWMGRQIAEAYNYLNPEKDSLFLTKTISLQNQYIKDFPEITKLMSASNYDCAVDYVVPIPSSEKHHGDCKYTKSSGMCQYAAARVKFNAAKLKILNYAFFLYGLERYNTTGLLIVDEAHNFETSILETFSLNLDLNTMASDSIGDITINRFLPNYQTISALTIQDVKAIEEYSSAIGYRATELYDEIEETMKSTPLDSKTLMKLLETKLHPLEKKMKKYSNICSILAIILGDDIDKWDIKFDTEKKAFNLKSVFLPRIIKTQVLSKPDKIVFMSATAERIKDSLKLSDDECELIVCPYIFDLAKRPLYAITSLPRLNMSSYDTVYPTYVETADSIIDQYPTDTNILIHSVSYKNAENFKKMSRHSKRVFIPTSMEVRELKSLAGGGKIIVSPSVTEGVDLGEGLAAVQIFMKVPYPYLGDSWIVRKKDWDEGWYEYTTILAIIQGSGRGVRSATDSSDTFVLDPAFKRLLDNTKALVPSWFSDSIQFI